MPSHAATIPDLPSPPGQPATVQGDDASGVAGTGARDVIAVLERLDAHYPAGRLIFLQPGDRAALRLPAVRQDLERYLAGKPGRFELAFSRTRASRRERFELFLLKAVRSALRLIRKPPAFQPGALVPQPCPNRSTLGVPSS